MKKIVFATLLLVAFVSCNKQQPQIDIRQENVNERNEYNAQISELAVVFKQGLNPVVRFSLNSKNGSRKEI